MEILTGRQPAHCHLDRSGRGNRARGADNIAYTHGAVAAIARLALAETPYLRGTQALSKLISRRNIRVKVMQTLYSMETGALPADAARGRESLTDKLRQTTALFLYLLYLLSEVARYAEKDALKRASKHLPTQDDLSVNTKVSGNALLWQFLEDPAFRKGVKEGHFDSRLDPAIVRRLYQALTASPEYRAYIAEPSRDKNGERAMLAHILNGIILPDDRVDEHLSEQFMGWDDDAEMIQTMAIGFLNRPAAWNLGEVISAEKCQFGEILVRTAIEKKQLCLEMIGAKLKNWDPDRIAVLDMVLMRMGLCELLFFETIPAKVTINEYIDLAKDYSTPQSGQFVNGILDGIHKALDAEGRLRKVEHRK